MATRKEPERRQRRNKPQVLSIGGLGEGGEIPEAPAGLLTVTRKAWAEFWTTPLAMHMQVTDLPALRRLFRYYDESERVIAEMRPKRRAPEPKRRANEHANDYSHRQAVWRREQAATGLLVHDDRGGSKLNPLARYRLELDERVNALEDRFGLSLAARQKIGLAQLKAQTLAESNAKTIAEPTDSDDSDPRAVLRLDQAKSRRKAARPKGD